VSAATLLVTTAVVISILIDLFGLISG